MRWQKEWIEQLVTGLPAREAVKDRLREELWGHLVSLYEEERARHPIEGDARYAACLRLGDSTAIEREIRSCQTVHERFEERLLRVIAPGGVTDVPAYAVGKAVRILAVSAIGLFLVVCFAVNLPGMSPISALATWITGTALLTLAAVSTGVVIYEINTDSGLRGAKGAGTARVLSPVPRFLQSAAAILFMTFSGWSIAYVAFDAVCVLTGRLEMIRVIDVFGWDVLLPASAFMALLSPALAQAFRWVENRARRLPDWPYSGPSRC